MLSMHQHMKKENLYYGIIYIVCGEETVLRFSNEKEKHMIRAAICGHVESIRNYSFIDFSFFCFVHFVAIANVL